MKIYPSLSGTTLEELVAQIELLSPCCSGFHIDIMDGHFVPYVMGNYEIINQLRQQTDKQFWLHLMVKDPLAILKNFILHPQDCISFHIEAVQNPEPFIDYCKSNELQPGVVLNPKTPLPAWAQLLYTLDHVTIMSVQPGRSGQTFLESTWTKLRDAQALRTNQARYFTIAVDGGVTKQNLSQLIQYGVNQVAIGSTIFKSPNPLETLKKLTDSTLLSL